MDNKILIKTVVFGVGLLEGSNKPGRPK